MALEAGASVPPPLRNFGNWSDYVADVPPVLLVRVTPKMVENFWTTVARGAARTQGVALPAIKHAGGSFSRMTALCGSMEITPVHPFKIEQRLSATSAIYEGLYVFAPEAFGPQCSSVKLVLYSEKDPGKGDVKMVDPKILRRIIDDFSPYWAPPR
jgi:hypothetical protein